MCVYVWYICLNVLCFSGMVVLHFQPLGEVASSLWGDRSGSVQPPNASWSRWMSGLNLFLALPWHTIIYSFFRHVGIKQFCGFYTFEDACFTKYTMKNPGCKGILCCHLRPWGWLTPQSAPRWPCGSTRCSCQCRPRLRVLPRYFLW